MWAGIDWAVLILDFLSLECQILKIILWMLVYRKKDEK